MTLSIFCGSLSLKLTFLGCLCRSFLCWPKSLRAKTLGVHVKKTQSLPSVCLRERICMNVCLSVCVYLCTLYTSLFCVQVCAFICSVEIPFPALGMFKASSCAFRKCLSLYSKNTCPAFYQAEQGWAEMITNQQILIHRDWNWFGLLAGLVWLVTAGWLN